MDLELEPDFVGAGVCLSWFLLFTMFVFGYVWPWHSAFQSTLNSPIVSYFYIVVSQSYWRSESRHGHSNCNSEAHLTAGDKGDCVASV